MRIAFYGIENQTEPDRYMPPRVIGYDGTAYRAQLLDVDEKGKPKGVYPVATLVLYFGMEHWKYPLTLSSSMDIPEELRPFINDYKVNLFEIAYLTDEQAEMFKSDFRYVVDYFIQRRKNKFYFPVPGEVKHIHETLELLNARKFQIIFLCQKVFFRLRILVDDNRFEDLKRITEDNEYRRKLCRELLVSDDK